MRVLHYIGVFSLHSETFIYDFIKNLEENGIENCVLTHNRYIKIERPFKKVRVVSEKVNFFKKIYYKIFHRYSIRNKIKVLEHIEKYNPDLIHAHFGPNGVMMYNLMQKYKLDVKLIVSFHGMDINVMPKKILNIQIFYET